MVQPQLTTAMPVLSTALHSLQDRVLRLVRNHLTGITVETGKHQVLLLQITCATQQHIQREGEVGRIRLKGLLVLRLRRDAVHIVPLKAIQECLDGRLPSSRIVVVAKGGNALDESIQSDPLSQRDLHDHRVMAPKAPGCTDVGFQCLRRQAKQVGVATQNTGMLTLLQPLFQDIYGQCLAILCQRVENSLGLNDTRIWPSNRIPLLGNSDYAPSRFDMCLKSSV